ncbi:MAG: class I SAM-dependent methyltransferase [Candidatus Omnitrophota bacterium]
MSTETQKFARTVSYESYQIDLSKVYYHKILRAVNRFSKNPTGRILDIGCWDGSLVAQFIGKRLCCGIEGNLAACRRANARGIEAQAVDMEEDLPFADGFFDCVIAAEVIEHVYDTDFFLREINPRRRRSPEHS